MISHKIPERKIKNERSLSANKNPLEDTGESSEGKRRMVLIRDYGLRVEQTYPQIPTSSWRGSSARQVYAEYLIFSFEQFVYFYIGLPRELKFILDALPLSCFALSLACTHFFARTHTMCLSFVYACVNAHYFLFIFLSRSHSLFSSLSLTL